MAGHVPAILLPWLQHEAARRLHGAVQYGIVRAIEGCCLAMTPADRIALRIYASIALNVGAGLCASLAILVMTAPVQSIIAQWLDYVMATLLTGIPFRIGFVLGFKAET
jgi:hypothetical protein